MNIYEEKMAKAFKLEYSATKDEKIALRDLATEFIPCTDVEFGEPQDTKDEFQKVFNSILTLDEDTLATNGLSLAERLFGIRPDAIKDYGSARAWYENNKEAFDDAYMSIIEYAKENNISR